MDDDVTEPLRYAWLQDGFMTAGTLAEYAKAWESRYYSGDGDDGMPGELIFWAGEDYPTLHPVTVTQCPANENDDIRCTFTANGETAHIWIDGRA